MIRSLFGRGRRWSRYAHQGAREDCYPTDPLKGGAVRYGRRSQL